MNFTLLRLYFTERSTCGELLAANSTQRLAYTLELPTKDGLPGSAIPRGTYGIELMPSPKFMASSDPWVQQYAERMPHLMDIPGRSLIMIHWGNFPEETEGCILVGDLHDLDQVGESRQAFERLYPMFSSGDTIEVQGGQV